MKKIKISGLSNSPTQENSYIVILSEESGEKKLPVILRPNESQRLVYELGDVKSKRINTHDFILSLLETFKLKITQIHITDFNSGIFTAELNIKASRTEKKIKCSIGDALILSLIEKCDVYMDSDIIEQYGFEVTEFIDNNMDYYEKQQEPDLEELNYLLELAISKEDYEEAARLRDIINKK